MESGAEELSESRPVLARRASSKLARTLNKLSAQMQDLRANVILEEDDGDKTDLEPSVYKAVFNGEGEIPRVYEAVEEEDTNTLSAPSNQEQLPKPSAFRRATSFKPSAATASTSDCIISKNESPKLSASITATSKGSADEIAPPLRLPEAMGSQQRPIQGTNSSDFISGTENLISSLSSSSSSASSSSSSPSDRMEVGKLAPRGLQRELSTSAKGRVITKMTKELSGKLSSSDSSSPSRSPGISPAASAMVGFPNRAPPETEIRRGIIQERQSKIIEERLSKIFRRSSSVAKVDLRNEITHGTVNRAKGGLKQHATLKRNSSSSRPVALDKDSADYFKRARETAHAQTRKTPDTRWGRWLKENPEYLRCSVEREESQRAFMRWLGAQDGQASQDLQEMEASIYSEDVPEILADILSGKMSVEPKLPPNLEARLGMGFDSASVMVEKDKQPKETRRPAFNQANREGNENTLKQTKKLRRCSMPSPDHLREQHSDLLSALPSDRSNRQSFGNQSLKDKEDEGDGSSLAFIDQLITHPELICQNLAGRHESTIMKTFEYIQRYHATHLDKHLLESKDPVELMTEGNGEGSLFQVFHSCRFHHSSVLPAKVLVKSPHAAAALLDHAEAMRQLFCPYHFSKDDKAIRLDVLDTKSLRSLRFWVKHQMLLPRVRAIPFENSGKQFGVSFSIGLELSPEATLQIKSYFEDLVLFFELQYKKVLLDATYVHAPKVYLYPFQSEQILISDASSHAIANVIRSFPAPTHPLQAFIPDGIVI